MSEKSIERKLGELDIQDRLIWDLEDQAPFASVYVEDAGYINETTGEETAEYYYEYYWKVLDQQEDQDAWMLVRSVVHIDENGQVSYDDHDVKSFTYAMLFPELVKIEILRDMLTEGIYA